MLLGGFSPLQQILINTVIFFTYLGKYSLKSLLLPRNFDTVPRDMNPMYYTIPHPLRIPDME